MRAAVYHGRLDVRIEDVPEPEPGPGQVKIRVAHNGICGSDLHEYFSGPAVIPTRPHPLNGAALPVILGHEFSGTVAAVGDGVGGLRVGMPAAIRPNYSCGRCAHARSARPTSAASEPFTA